MPAIFGHVHTVGPTVTMTRERFRVPHGAAADFSPLILSLPPCRLKTSNETLNLKSFDFVLLLSFPFFIGTNICKRISVKAHIAENKLVTGPKNILFAGVRVCTFQPGNFRGWGSGRVNASHPDASRPQ